MIAQYSGEDTNWDWADYEGMPAIQTETGFDIVVPKSNVQQILTDGVIINHGGYTITQIELIPSHPVYVAGAVGDKTEGADDQLFSQAWKLLDDNEMTQDATSALYVKTYENVVFTEAATINCKVVLDDVWYGTADGANVTFDIPEAGTYNIEVTFDATTHEVAVNVVKHVALTLLNGPNISSNEFDKYDDDVKVILSIANETEPYESRNTWGIGQGSNIGNWNSTDNSIVLTGKDGETFDIMITVGDLKRAAKNGTDAYVPSENNPEGGVTFNVYNGCTLTGVTILAPVTNDKPAPLYVIGDISTGGWVRTDMTQMEYNLQTQAYEYSFTIDNEFATFAFADYQQTAEEAEADPQWTTFNSEYRWDIGAGDVDASSYVNGDAVQLVKGVDGTVKLPKGTYTVSVNPETMMMTITGTITPKPKLEYNAVYVAGNGTEGSAWMNGVTWNPLAEANKMTKVEGTDDVWEITFKDVPASSGDEGYQLKFIPSGQWSADESTTWSVNFGGDFIGYGIETPAAFNSNNIVFTTTAEQQDITLRIDLSNCDPTTYEGATFTVIAPKEQNTYVVAGCVGEKEGGADDELFGKAWDGTAEANQLAYDATSKLYTKTYEAVTFEAQTQVKFKIVINGKLWVPAEDQICEIPAAGTYDITVTYNAETGEAAMTATLLLSHDIAIAEDIEHGSVATDLTEAKSHTMVTITVTPDEDYELDKVTVKTDEETPKNVVVTQIDETTYTFEMPDAKVSVSATFIHVPVHKNFAASEVFIPTSEAVADAVAAYWVRHGGNFTNNKKRYVTPNLNGDVTEQTNDAPGVGIKKGTSAKTFETYVTNVKTIYAYVSSTSNSETRLFYAVATPTDGSEALTFTKEVDNQTSVVEMPLDATKKWKIEYIGYSTAKDDSGKYKLTEGKDLVLHGLKIISAGTDGIDGVNASKYAEGEWYTTGGVRIDQPTKKGLYIHNGKKVVMK